MKNVRRRLGFTLIEIMVVISIISLLASVLYINFNAARENSRDQVRKTDLKQLQLAIELYKAQNDSYPASGCGTADNEFAGPRPDAPNDAQLEVTVSGLRYRSCEDWIVGLVPEFMAELPSDPTSESELGQGFYYRSDGSSYKIIVKDSVERNFITSYNQEFARCPRGTGNIRCFNHQNGPDGDGSDETYALYSSGAENW